MEDNLQELFSTQWERDMERVKERMARKELHLAMQRCHWLNRLRYWGDLEAYKQAIGL